MSRAADNPVYDDVQQNEIEDTYNEGVAEIQPAPAAEIPAARAPPNPTGQRFTPPPPPPTESRPQYAHGTIPSRPSQRYQQNSGRPRQGRDSMAILPSQQFMTKTPTGHLNRIAITATAPRPRYSHTTLRYRPKHHSFPHGKRG